MFDLGDKVRAARAPIHAVVEGLANAVGVPFFHSDDAPAEHAPKGAIGVLFYGMDRIGIVIYGGDGHYRALGSSDRTDRIIDACRFAIEVLQFKEENDANG